MATFHGGTLRHKGSAPAEREEKGACRYEKELSPRLFLFGLQFGSVFPVMNVAGWLFFFCLHKLGLGDTICARRVLCVGRPNPWPHQSWLEAVRSTLGPWALALESHGALPFHYLKPTLHEIRTFVALGGRSFDLHVTYEDTGFRRQC